MKCPYCNTTESSVIESRVSNESIRRRRECEDCGKRFTTYERVECATVSVVKRDGRSEVFHRDKLLRSIIIACHKRPVSRERMEAIASAIEQHLRNKDTIEVQSKYIGGLVMDYLHSLDQIAYVRFASVYKKFKDTKQFTQEIKKMKLKKPKLKVE